MRDIFFYMNNSIQIRKALIQDRQSLAALCSITFYDTYHAYNTKENMDLFLEQHFNIDTVSNELNDLSNTFILAVEDEELCGYVKLSESNPPHQLKENEVIEIARIYSVKEKIGKGIGQLLLDESISIAKQKQKQFIWLGVWKENKRAIAFYQKNKFEIFGEHHFILGKDVQDDWLMQLSVQ